MATVDKAAIAWSIAIVAAGTAFAGYGSQLQESGGPTFMAPSPMVPPAMEEPKKVDPFAEEAAKVKEQAAAKQEQIGIEEKVTVTAPKVEAPKVMGPKTVEVSMPVGTSTPGCEVTNECYLPASVSISVGDTVVWNNVDTAAHTVTSGNPSDGPDGVFDSSLVMAGKSFEFTFNEAGSYEYFCMVHPWMIGTVQVS